MRIETERLLLRPFAPEDAADLLAYLKEPAVHCFEEMRLYSLDDGRSLCLWETVDYSSAKYLMVRTI